MSKIKTITSYSNLIECIGQLSEFGCKVTNRHVKILKDKGLIIFRKNLIILDEFNLLK